MTARRRIGLGQVDRARRVVENLLEVEPELTLSTGSFEPGSAERFHPSSKIWKAQRAMFENTSAERVLSGSGMARAKRAA